MKLALAALMVVLMANPSLAGEFERNPDRFPSIGLHLQFGGESGDATFEDSGLSAKQNVDVGTFALTFDLRAPVSNSWTIFGNISLTGTDVKSDPTPFLIGGETKTGGVSIGVGARYYFNQ